MKKNDLFFVILVMASVSGFSNRINDEDKTLSPYFIVNAEESATEKLPLKSVFADVHISGIIADVTILQEYKNEGRTPLEAIYVFPGSTRAAVYGMKMKIGERTVIAQIEEKGKAKSRYEEAKNEGKTASLLEQHRPNVFQMQIANILPGDVITVELNYTELIIPENDIFEFVFPAVVGPRYSNSEQPIASAENWVHNPYTGEGVLPSYPVGLKMVVTSPVAIRGLNCSSHKVDIDFRSKKKAFVSLSEAEKTGGNRDVIIRYSLKGEKTESGMLLFEGKEENFFLATIQPPVAVKPEMIPPREYVFIVDVSGSMHGYPLEISKKLLAGLIGSLKPTDKFNVLLFAGGSSLFAEKSLDATEDNIRKAIEFINSRKGGGGTELLPALKKALSLKGTENYSRSFIIATDGYVDVEKNTFDLIRDNLGKANFFPFGIGSSVNRYIIEGMAHVGQGIPFIVTREEEAGRVAEKFKNYVQNPVMTNISLSFEGFHAYDLEPPAIPDVLAERPVVVIGKWKGEAAGRLVLKGLSGNTQVTETIDIASSKPDAGNAGLQYLWARERILLLDDYAAVSFEEETGKEVLRLGLQHNLLTRYTSFIAVDSEVRNKGGKTVEVYQPLPLPQGVSEMAIGTNSYSGGYGIEDGTVRHYNRIAKTGTAKELISNKNLNSPSGEDPEADNPPLFLQVEQMPTFKGGADNLKKFLHQNLVFPEDALFAGISGNVMVGFTVEPDGSISGIHIVSSVFPSIDREAMRLAELMDNMWTPGLQRGIPVKTRVVITISFVI